MAKRRKNLTTWQALEKHPPYFVRMLAKNERHEALTDAELAILSGLTLNRVREIKFMRTWDRITVCELMAFVAACGFDPTSGVDRHRVETYELICTRRKAVPFQYLRKSPKWESEFLPLVKMFGSRPQSSAA